VKKIIATALLLYLPVAFSGPVGASDKFTYKGDYFLRCRLEHNRENKKDNTDDREYYHQRVRTHLFYQVLEEVQLELRADWNEGGWGNDVGRDAAPDTTEDYRRAIQIERASVLFSKPVFDAKLGLQQNGRNNAFGLDYIYRPQAAGLSVQLRLPLTIDASYYKYSEGDSDDETVDLLTDDKKNSEDTNLYGAQVSHKSEGLNAGLLYAAKMDRQTGDNPQVGTLWGSTKLGPAEIGVEVDFFFGNRGDGGDFVGNQLYLDAAVALGGHFTIGGHGYYAMGSDTDDEEVVSRIEVYGPWVPNIENGMPACTWDGIETLAGPHAFDDIGDNAGQVGGDFYVKLYIGDFEIAAQSYYLVPEEDSATEKTSEFGVCGGISYTYKKRVILALGGLYSTPDYDDDRENEASIGSQGVVRVKF
jgi:hypothetical protein